MAIELTPTQIKNRAPDTLIGSLSDGDQDLQQLIDDGISIVVSLIPTKSEQIQKEAVINYIFYNLWLGIGNVEAAEPYISTYIALTTNIEETINSNVEVSSPAPISSEELEKWGY